MNKTNKQRSEKLKLYWAQIPKSKRSKRNKKGGKALWAKIRAGSLTT